MRSMVRSVSVVLHIVVNTLEGDMTEEHLKIVILMLIAFVPAIIAAARGLKGLDIIITVICGVIAGLWMFEPLIWLVWPSILLLACMSTARRDHQFSMLPIMDVKGTSTVDHRYEHIARALEQPDMEGWVLREWVTGSSCYYLNEHKHLNGQFRPFGTPFTTPNGNAAIHPHSIPQCSCTIMYHCFSSSREAEEYAKRMAH